MMWLIQGLGFLASAAFLKPLLTRALIALGFSLVSYTGISLGTAAVWAHVQSNFGSLPVECITVLSMMKIPNALNVIISAYGAALAIRGLTAAGSLKRAVWRPGQSGDLFGAG
jgi:Protein of unknown function (DUF2523)